MNQTVEQNLSNLVRQLTTSGSRTLNEEKIKQLKQICKQSDVNVEYCYRLLHAQLSKNHSEIRYSTFQIIDQLFNRSHHFRSLLLENFNYIIENCLGLSVNDQLPNPYATAKLLRQFAATSIKMWHGKFGTTYKLLDVAFNYLKNCKHVNFDNIDEPIGITAEIERERQRSNQIRLNEKLQEATREMNETSNEIHSYIKQAENCLDLLIPKRNPPTTNEEIHSDEKDNKDEDQDQDDDDDDDDDDFIDVPLGPVEKDDKDILQLLGVESHGKYTITINLGGPSSSSSSSVFHIQLTDDNRALIENLHDLYRQLNDVYLTKIQAWMKIFIEVQHSTNEQQSDNVIKRAIDLKNSIQLCLKMIENYSLGPKRPAVPQKSSTKLKATPMVSSSPVEPNTTPTLTEDEVRYFFHGDSDCLKRTFKQVDVENPFIRQVDREFLPDNLNHSLLMRKRTFVQELPKIKWKCRAPMGNGKLCERMDRYKCPFHGRIVARDESGQADDESIRLKEEQAARKRSVPEWQDPEMLEDIRLATGLDLRVDQGNKRKKKKESGLTDLAKEVNTPRYRLEQKILNKAALKRIGSSLENEERQRHYEKFHHQFNYSLNN